MSDVTNNDEVETVEAVEATPEVVETEVVEAAAEEVAVEAAAEEVVEETPAEEVVVEEAPVEAVVEVVAEAPVAAPVEKKPANIVVNTVPRSVKADVVETEDDGARGNSRKVREGIVISNKMDQTLVVAVNERVAHPKYGKTVQRTKKLYAHDANNDAKIGDKVRVQETRPLSKLKRWRLTEIVERAR